MLGSSQQSIGCKCDSAAGRPYQAQREEPDDDQFRFAGTRWQVYDPHLSSQACFDVGLELQFNGHVRSHSVTLDRRSEFARQS